MKRWNIGKYKHVIVWTVVVVYIISANQIYNNLVLQVGKPVGANMDLPVATKDITYKLNDLMQPVRVNGQNLYQIKGYAFKQINPEEGDKISVVLVSATSKVAYSTDPVQYPNMIESYKGYNPGMNQDEFSLLISKSTLKSGTYQIGILLEDPVESVESFVVTGARIQKTPNTLKYIPAPG